MVDELLDLLRKLETELHRPQVRQSVQRLDQLLHADFREIGRSGQTHDRNAIIKRLPEQSVQPIIESWDFKAQAIAGNAALLTYRSAHRLPNGEMSHHAHRSSIWVQSPQGWQVLYHQGTPI